MTTKTRESKALEKAEARIKGMQDSGTSIDLGNGISLENYAAKTLALRKRVDAYNAQVKALEEERQNILKDEKELNDFSEHVLLGVGAVYGKQSKQYEEAGGSRKSAGGWVDRN
jgi:CII-binding regulator of phage lambda lysogenization HflD